MWVKGKGQWEQLIPPQRIYEISHCGGVAFSATDKWWNSDCLEIWTPRKGEPVTVRVDTGTVLVGVYRSQALCGCVELSDVGMNPGSVYVSRSRIVSIEPRWEDKD